MSFQIQPFDATAPLKSIEQDGGIGVANAKAECLETAIAQKSAYHCSPTMTMGGNLEVYIVPIAHGQSLYILDSEVNDESSAVLNSLRVSTSTWTPLAQSKDLGWKTYRYTKYGISFQYPSNYTKVVINNDSSVDVLPPNLSDGKLHSGMHISVVSLGTQFNVAMDSYTLKYDVAKSSWGRENANGTFSASCETNVPLGTQKVPSYVVGNSHEQEYAVLLKNGILHLTETSDDGPIPPDAHKSFEQMLNSITFDDSTSVLKASCN